MAKAEFIRAGGGRCYLRSPACPQGDSAFYDSFFSADYIRAHDHRVETAGGRGTALLFERDGRELVSRHYWRGGLWGKLAGDRFFRGAKGSARAFDEFLLLQRLCHRGLPVPEPYLARKITSGLCCRNDLVTLRISQSRNLADIIRDRELSPEEMERIGKVLAQFFAAGVLHTDLNIRNILLDTSGAVFIIDFDKCSDRGINDAQKQTMVARLRRSFRKEKSANATQTHFDEDSFAFLSRAALGL